MILLYILVYISAILSRPCCAGHARDESRECLRVTKYMDVRLDRVVSDRLHENRTALPPIRQEPAPKVSTLARSTDGSPTAAEEREVQKNNRVGRTQPDLNYVIRP